ncbi:hypothetical protein Gotur_024112 [Gossypium turneri]
MRQSLISLTDLIRGLHQSRQFWQKPSNRQTNTGEQVRVDSSDVCNFF